jgi:hypothetical protein
LVFLALSAPFCGQWIEAYRLTLTAYRFPTPIPFPGLLRPDPGFAHWPPPERHIFKQLITNH